MDLVIGRSVKALCAIRGVTLVEVAEETGISRGGLFSKVKAETRFAAWEVDALARYFDVPIGSLYDGLNGLVRPADVAAAGSHATRPLRGPVARHLTLVHGGRDVRQDLRGPASRRAS